MADVILEHETLRCKDCGSENLKQVICEYPFWDCECGKRWWRD